MSTTPFASSTCVLAGAVDDGFACDPSPETLAMHSRLTAHGVGSQVPVGAGALGSVIRRGMARCSDDVRDDGLHVGALDA